MRISETADLLEGERQLLSLPCFPQLSRTVVQQRQRDQMSPRGDLPQGVWTERSKPLKVGRDGPEDTGETDK